MKVRSERILLINFILRLASILAALASWYRLVKVSLTFPSMETLSPIFGVIRDTSLSCVNGRVDGYSIAW